MNTNDFLDVFAIRINSTTSPTGHPPIPKPSLHQPQKRSPPGSELDFFFDLTLQNIVEAIIKAMER
jgi:hypothetical protein